MFFTLAMALSVVLTIICIFVSTCKFGSAYNYPPYEYAPPAEAEGGGTNNEYYPHEPGSGAVGANPGPVLAKALECFNDKNLYSSCEEAYRLTQNGELNVPVEYADEFCSGACVKETHLVLECIDEVLQNEFVFYNKATVEDVKETIDTGCSYGPKRGDFNVEEHIQNDEGVASKICTSFIYGLVMIIMASHVILF